MKHFSGVLSTQLFFLSNHIKEEMFYIDKDGKVQRRVEENDYLVQYRG